MQMIAMLLGLKSSRLPGSDYSVQEEDSGVARPKLQIAA